jgi:hypothetical protein
MSNLFVIFNPREIEVLHAETLELILNLGGSTVNDMRDFVCDDKFQVLMILIILIDFGSMLVSDEQAVFDFDGPDYLAA